MLRRRVEALEAELAQVKARAQHDEALLRAVTEHSNVSIWAIDNAYRLTLANATYVRTEQAHSGRETRLGQSMPPDWLPEPARSELRAIYGRALHGETMREERVTTLLSGELMAWETTFNPVVDPAGRVLGVSCIARDVTARKAAETALRRSEDLYRTIVRNLPDAAILAVGHDLRYLIADGPLLPLLGHSLDELEGHRPDEVLDPTMGPLSSAYFRSALAGERLTRECTYVGRVLWARYVPLRDAEGRVYAAMSLVLDITERKRLEAQLLHAQKMETVGQLAGGIAHDFNNLLTAIRGYAEFVLSELPPDTPSRDDVSEILSASDRASALTRQLLAFARRQRLEMQALNLNSLIGNLEKLLRRLIGAHISLDVEPAAELQPVLADSGQLEQVLVNLAINARDAMPQGGSLTIATNNVELDTHFTQRDVNLTPGRYVQLTVSDTGVGMSPAVQSHLFEPFFTTKPQGQGTGLGLATCYGIVKQHGGAIWIYSELGYGTVVKIYLPQANADPVAAWQESGASTLVPGTETVLIVEDEAPVRALAARVLRACGYSVLEAADGEEALRVAWAHGQAPIHLLLSDVVMPVLSGPAAAAQLRAERPGMRVLFMSGYLGPGGPQQDGAIEAAPVLPKPFSAAGLTAAVRSALDS